MITTGIGLGGLQASGAMTTARGSRGFTIQSADDEEALLVFQEENTTGLPNNTFQTVATLETNIDQPVLVTYTLSTSENGVTIRFDGNESETGGSLSGSVELGPADSRPIDLEASTPGQIDDPGQLGVSIPAAEALDESIVITDAAFALTFTTSQPPPGSVTLPTTVSVADEEIPVDYTFEDLTDAHLMVGNDRTGIQFETTVFEDGTELVDAQAIGGLAEDDTIEASLWDDPGRSIELACDTTVVTDQAIPATVEIVAAESIGNNGSMAGTIDIEVPNETTITATVSISAQPGGGGVGTGGRGWQEKSVEIDGTQGELTALAADAIAVATDPVDLFDAAIYDDLDQPTLDGIRDPVTTDATVTVTNSTGDADLEATLVPR